MSRVSPTASSATCAPRLTPRARALLAAIAVCAVLVVAGLPSRSEAAGAADGGSLALADTDVRYTVRAGDTLWDIATALDPGADPRPLVDLLQRMNHLTGSGLSPGQELRVPRASR